MDFSALGAAIQAENVILFPNNALPLCKNHVGTSTLKPRVPFANFWLSIVQLTATNFRDKF